jgi:hypothetical protein
MTDWTVVCVRRIPAGRVTHLGVDVPRGTAHVPVEGAVVAIEEGRRFFVEAARDLLLLRTGVDAGSRAVLSSSRDQAGQGPLDTPSDRGTAVRFTLPARWHAGLTDMGVDGKGDADDLAAPAGDLKTVGQGTSRPSEAQRWFEAGATTVPSCARTGRLPVWG